jgi:hypothetical protein
MSQAATPAQDVPPTDHRDPATLVEGAVKEVLEIAGTWLAWDGRPIFADGNAWTPQKALRRVQDHLLDHLAEIECRLAGLPTVPDHWHGRAVTLDSDWSHFTETDLAEAASRLQRVARIYRARVGSLSDEVLDRTETPEVWTLRQVVFHVSDITAYAHFVGRLA